MGGEKKDKISQIRPGDRVGQLMVPLEVDLNPNSVGKYQGSQDRGIGTFPF